MSRRDSVRGPGGKEELIGNDVSWTRKKLPMLPEQMVSADKILGHASLRMCAINDSNSTF